MNVLFCSVGRRGELIKDFKNSMGENGKIVATDNSNVAPALYLADKQYIVPRITDENYIDVILDICVKEQIDAVATFIDPEISVLAANREKFEKLGIQLLVPYVKTAELCFNKYEMYKFLCANGIPTVLTYGDIESFEVGLANKKIAFPVFVKPRTGSGSVGARQITTMQELVVAMSENPELIIQELMTGVDLDADVYVDTVSHQVVSMFSKRKLSTTIGGANKTISFKDEKLFECIKNIVEHLELNGPNDMDFFYKDGTYYLSEINPRFGGAYLHAYGAGVDFVRLIEKNVEGKENAPEIGNYEDGVVMMMYDSVVIKKQEELVK